MIASSTPEAILQKWNNCLAATNQVALSGHTLLTENSFCLPLHKSYMFNNWLSFTPGKTLTSSLQNYVQKTSFLLQGL